mmetsp:Transcript_20075/g.43939  ORF Transcript_20075/g.43939 Transcript_20075/m.43939 type:complete len:203 (-) Transcript_20075:125-733(-)
MTSYVWSGGSGCGTAARLDMFATPRADLIAGVNPDELNHNDPSTGLAPNTMYSHSIDGSHLVLAIRGASRLCSLKSDSITYQSLFNPNGTTEKLSKRPTQTFQRFIDRTQAQALCDKRFDASPPTVNPKKYCPATRVQRHHQLYPTDPIAHTSCKVTCSAGNQLISFPPSCAGVPYSVGTHLNFLPSTISRAESRQRLLVNR